MKRSMNRQGYVLVLLLVMSSIFLTIGISIMSLVAARYQAGKRTVLAENAILAADAGVTDTLNKILNQPYFTGYGSPKQLYSDSSRGKAEYATTVVYDDVKKLYTVSSTGYAYKIATDIIPTNIKKVEVTASLAGSPVPARIATGPGGLVVNSGGSIGGKNIWVNGKVQVKQGLMGITGWTLFGPYADVSVNAANIACGTPPDYPSRCTGPLPGTGEAIQVTPSNNGIFGTVCANDQTTSTYIFPGQTGLGLIYNCSAQTILLAEYDRQALYDSMTQTNPGINCVDFFNPGPHNLVAKTLYTGTVNLASGFGVCSSTINGNVYIRGDLDVTGFGTNITVAEKDPQGNPITQPPIIAVEGKINLDQSFAHIYPNSKGVGVLFISFHSSNASCNTNPACTKLSSTDLFNSVNVPTVTISNDFEAITSTFYSYFGTVDVQNGSVGAVSGQRVLVESNGGISSFVNGGINKDSFPSGDAFGGKVRAAAWNIVNYRQIYP